MWEPAVVTDGAINYHAIRAGDFPPQGAGTYVLEPDDRVPFDPADAE